MKTKMPQKSIPPITNSMPGPSLVQWAFWPTMKSIPKAAAEANATSPVKILAIFLKAGCLEDNAQMSRARAPTNSSSMMAHLPS